MFSTKAQFCCDTIPNGSLERWNSFGGWYENPEFWETNNNQIISFIQKDNDAYERRYSMKVNHNGFARTEFKKPQYACNSLNFYYKYFLEHDDTISIKFVNKNGVCSTDTLENLITANIDSSQWYYSFINNTCYESDTFVVIIEGAKSIGSYLKIDSMYLSISTNNIIQNNKKFIFISPNPTSDYANIENLITAEDISVSLYDITANHIKTFILPAKSTLRINLQNYSKGFYFLKYRYGCIKLIKL